MINDIDTAKTNYLLKQSKYYYNNAKNKTIKELSQAILIINKAKKNHKKSLLKINND